MTVDMSNLASVRDFATSLSALINSSSLPRIRALVCAAAVMQVGGKRTTEDGMEATFQINYLANFLLVMLLLPVMRRDCRVIFLTSNLIYEEGRLGASKVAKFHEYVAKLPDPVAEETGKDNAFAEGTARYAISKVLLSMFAAELQQRFDARSDLRGMSVVLLDPGTFISGTISGTYGEASTQSWSLVLMYSNHRISACSPNSRNLRGSASCLSSVVAQEDGQDEFHERQTSRQQRVDSDP